jgi:16S rRNA (guanine1516-N2)-methyltransferase
MMPTDSPAIARSFSSFSSNQSQRCLMYVTYSQPQLKPYAAFWAHWLSCKLAPPLTTPTTPYLECTPQQLVLHLDQGQLTLPITGTQKKPDKTHPLLKAVGSKRQIILDTTGGLGNDSFLLASYGHQVITCEQNRALCALLFDAIASLQQHQPRTLNWMLYPGNSLTNLQHYPKTWLQPDCVLIDPMYPELSKNAKPKKSMALLRAFITAESKDQECALLQAARQLAQSKVIVKRPKHAPHLGNSVPHHQIVASKRFHHRFDVYLPVQEPCEP